MSRASSEEVVKFVLFGREFSGSEVVSSKLQDYNELKDYVDGEGKWSGLFNLKNYEGKKLEIVEDAIIESINIINKQNRVLTGVSDDAGRRPPDLNQMMYLKNSIESFLKNPNKTIFNNLLFEYRVIQKERKGDYLSSLVDLFYGTKQKSYEDNSKFLEDLFKKGRKSLLLI